ncbi:hypothetical protein AZF01_09285 [Martelella sp. AD-3]|nr:hypothetical protein AZF01_09285 [Martelella sp. AD-3]
MVLTWYTSAHDQLMWLYFILRMVRSRRDVQGRFRQFFQSQDWTTRANVELSLFKGLAEACPMNG